MTKRILIIGSSGFVGLWLVKELLQHFLEESVYGTYCSSFPNHCDLHTENIFQIDLRSPDSVQSIIASVQPDVVVHLAALRKGSLTDLLSINVVGFQHVLDSLAQTVPDARIVLVGSAAEIGRTTLKDIPLNEGVQCHPVDNYGLTKQAQSNLAQIRAFLGQDIVRLRVFNLLAPNLPATLLPGKCARLLSQISGDDNPINLEFGPLETRRDYLDVRDLVRAIGLAIDRGNSGRLYHIGFGCNLSGHEIVQTLINLSGLKNVSYSTVESTSDSLVPFQTADNHLARTELGWVPRINPDQALKDLLDYQIGKGNYVS
jgi:GDP-4-dehydro-6-deoxy-D-mannose reductase